MCFCVFFFADIQKLIAKKPSELKILLATLESQSNENDTVDNNGDNEALPTGSDTRDNGSSVPKKVDNSSPLDQLVDVAVQKVENGADSEAHIAFNRRSNKETKVEHSNKNPNELLSDQSNAAGNDSNQDNTGSTSAINLFGTSSESESAPEEDDISANETVSKVKKNAVTATEIASDTSSNDVSEAKHSSKNPNKDETKDRLSDQSNAAGNDSNQDNHEVHPNTNTDALAKAAALSKNAGNTSGTDFGSSESESAAGEEDVPIPYQFADDKWDYIMCDINNIKKHAENACIEVELRIQTCFFRSGQYQGDFVQLPSEFVLVWHFLCYLFNFLCCPF